MRERERAEERDGGEEMKWERVEKKGGIESER